MAFRSRNYRRYRDVITATVIAVVVKIGVEILFFRATFSLLETLVFAVVVALVFWLQQAWQAGRL